MDHHRKLAQEFIYRSLTAEQRKKLIAEGRSAPGAAATAAVLGLGDMAKRQAGRAGAGARKAGESAGRMATIAAAAPFMAGDALVKKANAHIEKARANEVANATAKIHTLRQNLTPLVTALKENIAELEKCVNQCQVGATIEKNCDGLADCVRKNAQEIKISAEKLTRVADKFKPALKKSQRAVKDPFPQYYLDLSKVTDLPTERSLPGGTVVGSPRSSDPLIQM